MPEPLPAVFRITVAAWPLAAQQRFHDIRKIVLEMADHLDRVRLVETLKWGEPASLPDKPRIGSTLRVAWKPARPTQICLFLNCNTTLVETMRSLYPDDFAYAGNRALWLDLNAPVPEQAISHCATLTLTYHRKTA